MKKVRIQLFGTVETSLVEYKANSTDAVYFGFMAMEVEAGGGISSFNLDYPKRTWIKVISKGVLSRHILKKISKGDTLVIDCVLKKNSPESNSYESMEAFMLNFIVLDNPKDGGIPERKMINNQVWA